MATASMHASIVVCTYNRAASLRDTLAALAALQSPPDCAWEVLVVDNNSRDDTAQVVTAAQADWPRLRYVFESRQGLSHARNRGIAESSGEIILFTDDDVLPEPDWLVRTLDGLARFGADACGGYIAPIWEKAPPDWLTERFYGFLAVRTDRTDDFMLAAQDATPYGANMAFRRRVFERVGLFDVNRGRKGNVLAGGEDGEMFDRLFAADLPVVFLGSSRVHHKVEAFRTTKAYLRRWRRQASRNLAIARGVPGTRRLGNVPLYLFPQCLRAVGRAIFGHLFLPRDEAFHREMIVCHFIGTLEGLWSTRASHAGPH
ncbi:MAG: glycosyltransferase [Gammaproteobacteria bacterium]